MKYFLEPRFAGPCQHTNTEFIPTPGSIHHGKTVCRECGRFIRFEPKPETADRKAKQEALIRQLASDSMPLSEWERGFIKSIAEQKKLSPKQVDKLQEVARRHHL